MSFDDELRNRMKQAATDAGRSADPSAAAAHLASTTSSTATVATPAVLKVVGGLAALGIVTGAVLGATVLRSDQSADAATAADVNVQAGATFDCPGGAAVGSLQPGDRVYVVGRDDSGEWSAVRDPAATIRVVWVRETSLVPDDDPGDVPIVECDDDALVAGTAPETSVADTVVDTTIEDVSTSVAESLPESTTPPATTAPPTATTQAPGPTPPTTAPPTVPTTPPDTQPPTLQAWTSHTLIGGHAACSPDRTTLNAIAGDNVGVTSVSATFGPAPSGSITLQRTSGTAQNGTWTATFGPFPNLDAGFDASVQIQISARDAAGRTTATSVSVRVQGSNCGLI